MTSFVDYTEEDQRLHDFIITHNRKLKDIKTIVSNIMWSLCALCDSFGSGADASEAFEFISEDPYTLRNIVTSFEFTPYCTDAITRLIDIIRHETRTPQKYCELQTIARKHDLQPMDLLKVAKTNFVELCKD